MKYMGSKNRHAKELLPIILKDRKPGQWYVEPFVGGANMIDKVDGNRIGADIHCYLIEALELIRDDPHSIPDLISEDDYQKFKNKNNNPAMKGFVGFAMSFGGKWFGGYRRDKAGSKGCIENMKTQTRRSKANAIQQSSKIQDVKLICEAFDQLKIPPQSIIYCDPPYAGTTKYKDGFDHEFFWQWCRERAKEGHQVFISEYNAPDDFKCLWEKKVNNTLTKDTGSKQGIEKLFIYDSQK